MEKNNNLVLIEGGTFTMGSPENETGRRKHETQHQVTVSGFYLAKYPVTQNEYERLMGTNPSNFRGQNLPVENVSWFDTLEYCNKLSEAEGLSPVYAFSGSGETLAAEWNREADGYRLPTEAEWEYACRAGTATPYNTGENITKEQANFGSKMTSDVGSFAPNAWGLYDMHGNVSEWCWDLLGPYPVETQSDPEGAQPPWTHRVIRGGCWYCSPEGVRSAYRVVASPWGRESNIGFRVAIALHKE
jgi:formylglycine-generating enzyme required for sulfatase activity